MLPTKPTEGRWLESTILTSSPDDNIYPGLGSAYCPASETT